VLVMEMCKAELIKSIIWLVTELSGWLDDCLIGC
jgi:hypothetical protein